MFLLQIVDPYLDNCFDNHHLVFSTKGKAFMYLKSIANDERYLDHEYILDEMFVDPSPGQNVGDLEQFSGRVISAEKIREEKNRKAKEELDKLRAKVADLESELNN
jgi:hypothetical protein